MKGGKPCKILKKLQNMALIIPIQFSFCCWEKSRVIDFFVPRLATQVRHNIFSELNKINFAFRYFVRRKLENKIDFRSRRKNNRSIELITCEKKNLRVNSFPIKNVWETAFIISYAFIKFYFHRFSSFV